MKKNRIISALTCLALTVLNLPVVFAETLQFEDNYTYTLYKENFTTATTGYDAKLNDGYNYVEYTGYESTDATALIDSATIAEEESNKYFIIDRFGTPAYEKANSTMTTYLSNATGISHSHTDLGFTGSFFYKVKFRLPDVTATENANKAPGLYLEGTTQIHSAYTGARAFMFETTAVSDSAISYSYQGATYDASSGVYTDVNNTGTINNIDVVNEWAELELNVNMATKQYTVSINGTELFTTYLKAMTMTSSREANINAIRIGAGRAARYIGEYQFDDIEISCDSTELLQNAVTELAGYDYGQDMDSVTEKIALPNTINGCAVSWASNNHTAVADDGTITRRDFTQTAKLTARLTPNSTSPVMDNMYSYHTVEVTIPKNDGVTDEQIVQDILDWYLTNENFTDEDADKITESLKLPQSLADGCSIVWTIDKDDYIATDGAVTRPAIGEPAETVLVSAEVTLGEITKTKDFTFTVLPLLSTEQKLDEAMDVVTYKVLTNEDPDELKENLTLPESGLHNTTITWESDNDDIISDKGVVVRPDDTTTVIMTATFACEGETKTKDFEFVVILSNASMAKKDAEAITIENADALTANFTLPLTGKKYESSFSWGSENMAVSVSGNSATVTRPAKEDGDSIGDLVVVSYNNGERYTHRIPVVVKSYKSASSSIEALEPKQVIFRENFENEEPDYNVKSNGKVGKLSYMGYDSLYFDELIDSAKIKQELNSSCVSIERFGTQSYDKTNTALELYLADTIAVVTSKHTNLGYTKPFNYGVRVKIPDAMSSQNKNVDNGMYFQGTTQIHGAYTGARAFLFEIKRIYKNGEKYCFTYSYTASEYNENRGAWEDKTLTATVENVDIVNDFVDFTISVNPAEFKYSIYANGKTLIDNKYLAVITRTETRPSNINCIQTGIGRGTAYKGEICVDDITVFSDKKEYLMNTADELSETDLSPELPGEVTQNLDLPDEVNGCPIEWTSSDTDIIGNDGTVTQRNFTQNVKLTAKFVPESESNLVQESYIEKTFDITVEKLDTASAEDTVGDILDYYLIDSILTEEKQDKITENLTIPTTLPDGATIEWSSNNVSIATNGTVTRPLPGESVANVTLTATVTLDGYTTSKEFDFTVLPEIAASQKLAEAMENVTYDLLTEQESDNITANIKLPTVGLYGVSIDWSTTNADAISEQGLVQRGTEDAEVTLIATFEVDGLRGEKTFDFTVPLNYMSMAQHDVDAIIIENAGNITEDIDLLQRGSLYKSTLTWNSNNDAAKVSGTTAIVKRPENGSGDVSVELEVVAERNGYKVQRKIPVTVTEYLPDSDYVQEFYDWLIFENISSEESTEVTRNLSIRKSYENGISCEWVSITPDSVTDSGVVLRGAPGTQPAEAKLKAVISKGETSMEKIMEFTVIQFENNEQLIEKATRELTFGVISNEAIDNVTENLTLPTQWRYDTTVNWRSSNSNVITSAGIVNRNVLMTQREEVILTAVVSYGTLTKEKTFKITVQKEHDKQVFLEENFEDMALGAMVKNEPVTDMGGYFDYSTIAISDMQANVVRDITNADNKVLEIKSTTEGYRSLDYVFEENSAMYTGSMNMKFKMYIPSDVDDYAIFEVRGNHGGILALTFYRDGTIRHTINQLTYINCEVNFPFDEWFEIEIDTNTYSRSYKAYLNGVDITKPDELRLSTDNSIYRNSYDDELGAEYIYSRIKPNEPKVQGIRLATRGRTGVPAYFDDLKIIKYNDTSDDVENEIKQFDAEFSSLQDLNKITSNLVFPEWKTKKTTFSFTSSDTGVITNEGAVVRSNTDKKVEFTVTFKYETVSISKKYHLTVSCSDEFGPENIIDTADAWLRNHIASSYALNSVSSNMALPTQYGTVSITWHSSNTSVISNSGVISRGSENKTATLTATLTIDEQTREIPFVITVLKNTTPVVPGGTGGNSMGDSVVSAPLAGNTVADEALLFTDVLHSHWASVAINYLYNNGLISGRGNNMFEPDSNVTRSEFIKILLVGLGVEAEQGSTAFNDITPSDWSYSYIITAESLGWVNGIDETTFGGSLSITRQDMAVIIHRALKAKGMISEDTTEKKEFSDHSKISDYAQEAIYALRYNGIMEGRGDNEFVPKDTVTRAEAATVIYNILK